MFYPQTDRQTEYKNSKIKVYFQAFVNCKQNNGVRLLLMAKFVYNNAKNTSTDYISFELNYVFILYKKDINS